MENRSFSELYRNTTEELFIKIMTESTIGMPAPTMEMLGFKNPKQNFRTDSEELFKSWLTNGENTVCHSTGVLQRPRQLSRRISAELASLTNRTAGVIQDKRNENENIIFPPPYSVAVDSSSDINRNEVEKDLQVSNLFLTQAWFQSSHPMTRSRSSELRRRYVAIQNSQTSIGMEATYTASLNNFKQESPNTNGFNSVPIQENANQFNTFMSSSTSSSSNFNCTQVGSADKISSVVSMLKGTLERKKLSNQGQVLTVYKNQGIHQNVTNMGIGEHQVLLETKESLLEGTVGPAYPNQTSTISREPSQSESSNCFDMFDDPCMSIQAPNVHESSRNQMGYGKTEDCYRNTDLTERVYDNSNEKQKKKRMLIRYGSVTSTGSEARGDPTKKRRVERSRKIAEVKERSTTPATPSDIQSILKRCENLEKEVRSLKLNLSFMNRKDSEQTKQIEELQKQNEELAEEKERLLDEIERIIPEAGRV